METKIYSSSGFSHQCSAEEMFVLTMHWLSDIVFFEQEIQFFQSLIHNYLHSEIDEQISHIAIIASKFKELGSRKELLKEEIISYQNRLAAILDKNNADKPSYINVMQYKLEGEIFDFIKIFRYTKLELFNFNRIKQTTGIVHNT
jgi:hypothetical protein